jgi:CheY-like chemotaxis protein
MRPKKRILLISGDELRTSTLKFMLVTRGYAVTAAADAVDAQKYIASEDWDLVLCDLPLPGVKDVTDTVHIACPHIPTLLLVGKGAPVPSELYSPIQERSLDATELLDRIKVMCARKRGPRKGAIRKPVVSEPAIEYCGAVVNL